MAADSLYFLTPSEISAIILSLKISATATLLSIIPGTAIGWLLARRRFIGLSAFEAIVYAPLALPPVATGILLLIIFGRSGPIGSFFESFFGLRLSFSYLGAIIAGGVVSFPLLVRSVRVAFETADDRIAAAAQTLGASRFDAFITVSLPIAAPGILSGVILGFTRCLGEFGATITFAGNLNETRTIPLAMFSALQRPGGEFEAWRLAALSLILSVGALYISDRLAKRAGSGR